MNKSPLYIIFGEIYDIIIIKLDCLHLYIIINSLKYRCHICFLLSNITSKYLSNAKIFFLISFLNLGYIFVSFSKFFQMFL
jgi:hypothetical protein